MNRSLRLPRYAPLVIWGATVSWAAGWITPAAVFAQADAKVPDPDPELERKTFVLPPGFEVNLFAADPMLAKPIQMNFDAQGRLWVATSETYPQIRPGETANDKILILEDSDGDGKADKTTIFADGLLIPTGVLPGDGGAYVANSTELVHLSASRPGGKADRLRVVLSGFGTEDTHHILHTFRWGPDGSLYFHQSIYIHSHVETPYGVQRLNAGGAWRFRPRSGELEVFLRGFINPWGHAFDRFGQSFLTDGANGEGITHGIPGAYYPTAQGPHAQRVLHGLNPGSPKHCGLEIISGRHFPDDWQGDLITCDFRGHRVCRFKIAETGSTFASREMPEVIKSTHPAFRPVDVKMGPDGALYIADWYNPIIQHGEVDFRDPRRDKTHGRIWRVTAKGRALLPRPNLMGATVAELLQRLADPEQWTRDQARRVLLERGAATVMPELAAHVGRLDLRSPTYAQQLLECLWLFHGLDAYRQPLPGDRPQTAAAEQVLMNALACPMPQVRAAAVRVVGESRWHVDRRLSLLHTAIRDESPRVRLEAVRALSRLQVPQAVEVALSLLDQPLDPVLDYALWLTVRELAPQWLPAFRRGQLTFAGRIDRLSFALQAVGSKEVVVPLRQLLQEKLPDTPQTDELWILLAGIGEVEDVRRVVERAATLVEPQAFASDEKRRRAATIVRKVEDTVRLRRLSAPAGVDQPLRQLLALAESEPAVCRLIGQWKVTQLRPLLRTLALEAIPAQQRPTELPPSPLPSSPALTQAAIAGLALYGDSQSRDDLHRIALHGSTPAWRLQAVMALVPSDPGEAARLLVQLCQGVPPSAELTQAFSTFLQQRNGPQALVHALQHQRISPDAARVGLQALRSSGQELPALREALRRAGGLDQARPAPTPEQIRALTAAVPNQGDPARGERLFRLKELQCFSCHAIAGVGGRVGPDLSSIGASAPVDYLVEALLLPNKAVKEGYHAQRIVTADEKVYLGIPVREADGRLVLRTAEDKLVTIPLADVTERAPAPSLMPEGLTDSLSRQEFLDLVAFLSQLGKVGTPYAPSIQPVIRLWETLEATPANLHQLRRQRVALAAQPDNSLSWTTVYSYVRGDLPLDELPIFAIWNDTAPLSVVRTRLLITKPGWLRLNCGDATGLNLYVNGQPVTLQPVTDLNLPTGPVTLTLVIDRSMRKAPLRLELQTAPHNPAQWSFPVER
ncbi:MAG: HEAT repeat domain-containing protein [Gemmataceae bacterium]|nr:HEAT repeat domain-containing protein [Gemmataceae bacterium]